MGFKVLHVLLSAHAAAVHEALELLRGHICAVGVHVDGLGLLGDDDKDGMGPGRHFVHLRLPRGADGPTPLHEAVDLCRGAHDPLGETLDVHAALFVFADRQVVTLGFKKIRYLVGIKMMKGLKQQVTNVCAVEVSNFSMNNNRN